MTEDGKVNYERESQTGKPQSLEDEPDTFLTFSAISFMISVSSS
jgi:hypothetical protein